MVLKAYKLIIASDHAGFDLKQRLKTYLSGSSIDDCGIVIIESKEKVRKKRIYNTNTVTGKKDDPSCVWIDGMYDAVEGLVIQNESGDVFELNYETLKVSSLGNRTKEEFHSIGKFLERARKIHKNKKENQASHTMSANARPFHIDPMEINLNRLGTSTEAAIVWI